MNRVVVNLGNFKLDDVLLDRGSLNIGRAPDNDITLEDPATSSHHAKIVTIFTSSFIQDLNSTNGTIVNGRKIVRHTLHHGDIISIGNLQLLFKSDNTAPKTETSKTMAMDKKALDALLSKPLKPAPLDINKSKGILVESAGNQLSGFSITVPKVEEQEVANDHSIPTLDETLPLDELRKDPSRTVVVKHKNESVLKSNQTLRPDQAETAKSIDIPPDEHEVHDIEIKGLDGYEDTVLSFEKDDSFDEQAMQTALLGDNNDDRSKLMAKITIAGIIVTIIILSLFLLF